MLQQTQGVESGDDFSHRLNRLRRDKAQIGERSRNALSAESLHRISESYLGKRLGVVVCFDPDRGVLDRNNVHDAARLTKRAAVNSGMGHVFRDVLWNDDIARQSRTTDRGDDGGVLVRIVEVREPVKQITLAAGECLKRYEGIADFLGRLFYHTRTMTFETGSAVASRKLQVAVLVAAESADEAPRHVVKRGSKVMDSIAYCQGNVARDFCNKLNPDDRVTSVVLYPHCAWVRFREASDLSLQFSDVAISPFDL